MLRFSALLSLLFVLILANAQPLAFPGAEGFGKIASGGRLGSVYHVTNLNDSGAGSLRDAVSQSNRIVVFDVGGVIRITDRIVIKKNITIAGQTAPGQGITIYGNGIALNNDSGNDIIQYIRIRMGKNGDDGKDAVGISDGDNYMFNHVSISWGRDGTFDINNNSSVGIDNVTLQDCIVSQGINNKNHSTGGLMQTGHFSLIRTLFIDNKTRNPKGRGPHESINSVIYNWGTNGYIMGDGGSAECNLIGNYFICGPSGSAGNYITGTSSTFKVYPSGNWLDGNKDGVLNGTELSVANGDYKSAAIMNTAYDYPGVTTILSAGDALNHVIEKAGASLVRDDVDKLLSEQVASYGTKGAIINTEDDNGISGGVGVVYNGSKPLDSDGDGMPDEWEDNNGTNKNLDDAMVIGEDGYANIENYINSIDQPFSYLKYPSNIRRSTTSASAILLLWTNLEENADNLTLEYGTSQSSFTESITLPGDAIAGAVSGLESGTTYYFRIKASNATTESAYTEVVSVQTDFAPVPPVQCSAPVPSNGGNFGFLNNVVLSWENTTTSLGGPLLYDVYFGTAADQMTLLVSAISDKFYNVGNLDAATTYFWSVKATNDLGSKDGVTWRFATTAENDSKILYIPFDETAGTDAENLNSLQNATAVNFTPSWTTGYKNSCIYFRASAVNAHMKLTHYPELYLNTAPFSISLWFKSTGSVADSYLFHKGTHAASNGGTGKWMGIQYKNSILTFGVDDNTTKTIAEVAGSQWFNDKWHHLVCVRDIATDKLKIYVDGVKVKEVTDKTGGIGETGDLIIGNRNTNFDNPYVGALDELTMFNSVLTDDEIAYMYNSTATNLLKATHTQNSHVLYPNPFTNQINIHMNEENGKDVMVKLYNVQGLELHTSRQVLSDSNEIAIEHLETLPKGIYFCHLTMNGTTSVHKIVK